MDDKYSEKQEIKIRPSIALLKKHRKDSDSEDEEDDYDDTIPDLKSNSYKLIYSQQN